MRDFYIKLDSLLKASSWSEIDELIINSPPEITDLNIVIAILIFSYKCKEKLFKREEYLNSVRKYLDGKKLNTEGILLNL